MMAGKKIGVLALQGDFIEHQIILEKSGVEAVQVRRISQLDDIEGLIIPGGESTTIGKLAQDFDMMDSLRNFGLERPVWGTCAGSIFLAKDVQRDQPLLGLMDIVIRRNAFGRQIQSFETYLDIPCLKIVDHHNDPFHAIFIRAPLIESVQADTQVLATLDNGSIVAAQQGHLLVTSFHPELTDDMRFHKYFLEVVN